MTIVVTGGRAPLTHAPTTQRRDLRGYAKSRRDYDRRRRLTPLDEAGRRYKAIVQRDPCAGCGQLPVDEANAADHIVPLADGGENAWENLAGLCRGCNAQKKGQSLLRWLHARRD